MFIERRQPGFTLLEVTIVIATVLILAGALLGIGKYLKIRASVQLCQSELEVIATALEQYYDDYEAFPFEADVTYDETALEADLAEADLAGEVTPGDAVDNDMGLYAASSVGLYYFLDSGSNSRKIIQAVTGELVTNKDENGNDVQLIPDDGSANIDLPRFVDPWGMNIRYEYLNGAAFPVLTSAGPDTIFDNSDDVASQ